MGYIVYEILIHLGLVLLTPYYLVRMVLSGKYRAGLGERFGFIGKKVQELGSARPVWFHAVSVGEARAAMPLLKRFRERYPDVKIVFSTVTPTGQEVAEREGAGLIDALIYMPLDFSWVVRSVVKRINPSLFVIVEKEYWPNIIRTVSRRGVPLVVVNGTISERSYKGFCRAPWFFKGLFERLSYFSARTETDADRAKALGVKPDKISVVGNLKFDMTAPSVSTTTEELGGALGISPGDRVIVAGSTHAGEEVFILDAFAELKGQVSGLKLIIAPRHPERFAEVSRLVESRGFSLRRRSSPGKGTGEVILLDTLGELFTAYSLATVAFVGGSLVDIGGHNLLEPAFFSKPVVFGPHIYKAADMADLIEAAGAGIKVIGEEGLKEALMGLLTDIERAGAMGERAGALLSTLRGSTEATIDRLAQVASL